MSVFIFAIYVLVYDCSYAAEYFLPGYDSSESLVESVRFFSVLHNVAVPVVPVHLFL